MALEIYWTQEAITTYNNVIEYLEDNWTEREILMFTNQVSNTLNLLAKGNVVFRQSVKRSYNETLITKHNLLIYRIVNQRVELITFGIPVSTPARKKCSGYNFPILD